MGVRKYYLFQGDGDVFIGPAVYFRLCMIARDLSLPLTAIPIRAKGQAWRKLIPVLYRCICAAYGGRYGTLQELKIRNPKRNTVYRDCLQWLRDRRPQRRS
jgi:hypothetical protein